MARSSAGVSVLSRAVRVLEAFDPGVRDLSLTQIARKSGMPASTAHRIVGELVSHGLLERMSTGRYRIGLRLWELAVRTPGAVGIREIAYPFLRRALDRIGQHVQLAVLQDNEILSLERLSSPNAVINLTVVGSRMPFYATSSGLVLAATATPAVREALLREKQKPYRFAPLLSPDELTARLNQVRFEGYAVTEGYIDPAATAIGVPVMGPANSVVAALTSVVPSANPQQAAVLHVLRSTSHAITDALTQRYSGL